MKYEEIPWLRLGIVDGGLRPWCHLAPLVIPLLDPGIHILYQILLGPVSEHGMTWALALFLLVLLECSGSTQFRPLKSR